MEKTAKLFFGGIPTDIEVNKLYERFGIPEKGILILYSEIEECIGLNRKTNRFRSVIIAWRKKLERESNILLKARMGEGFICLNNEGRVDLATNYYKQSIKKLTKSENIAIKTERKDLSPERLRLLNHIQNNAASLRQAAMIEARKLNLKKITEEGFIQDSEKEK